MKAVFTFKTFLLLIISIFLLSCSKEVWGGMNAYYKWQGEVDDLADFNFSTREQLNNYLSGFETPDDLFNSLIYRAVDNSSFIMDDFTILENAFDGIKLTTGMKLNGMTSIGSNEFYTKII